MTFRRELKYVIDLLCCIFLLNYYDILSSRIKAIVESFTFSLDIICSQLLLHENQKRKNNISHILFIKYVVKNNSTYIKILVQFNYFDHEEGIILRS